MIYAVPGTSALSAELICRIQAAGLKAWSHSDPDALQREMAGDTHDAVMAIVVKQDGQEAEPPREVPYLMLDAEDLENLDGWIERLKVLDHKHKNMLAMVRRLKKAGRLNVSGDRIVTYFERDGRIEKQEVPEEVFASHVMLEPEGLAATADAFFELPEVRLWEVCDE